MSRRRRACVLILACGLMIPAAPALGAQQEPSGWLELDAGPAGQVHRLTPGGSADWAVDVRVGGEEAAALEVELQPDGTPEVLREFLSVELRACAQPWVDGVCAEGQRTLMPRTALNSATGARVDLMQPGSSLSDGAHVLLTATLAEDVPREVQGSRTGIVVGVHGSGDGTAQPAGPPSGSLADTGARLGGWALLGLFAVAAGFGFARLRGAAQ